MEAGPQMESVLVREISGHLARSAHETGQRARISQALAKLETSFTILGIMIIVAIVLNYLFMVFAMAAGILTSTAGQ
jgi:hypothetical protein